MVIRRTEPRSKAQSQPVDRTVATGKPGQPTRADRFNETAALAAVTTAQVELTPTTVPHAWASPLRDTARQTAVELKAAGTLLHEGGDALELTDAIGLEAHHLGTHASTLATRLDATATSPHVPAGAMRADVAQLHERAEGLVTRATSHNLAQRVLDKLGDGARAIGRALVAYTQGISKAVDYEQNIDALGDEDTYTLLAKAFVMAGIPMVEATASVSVARKNGRYTVAMDGELGAGLFVDFGVKIMGAGADAFASAVAGKGARYELSFATADEAKRAVGLMLSRAGKQATLRELTPAEADLFKQNLSAVELRGHAALTGWAMLGLPSIWAAVAEGLGKASHVVRIENGDRPALVLTELLSSELTVSGNAAQKGELLALFPLGKGKGEMKLNLQRRIALDHPPDLASPMQSLERLRDTVDRSRAEEHVHFTFVGRGGLMGSGGGVGVELGIDASIEHLKTSGAISGMLRGDLEAALEKLPRHVEVESTFERFADYGVNVAPAAFFMGFGGGLELDVNRKDVDADHQHKAKAPVADAYRSVKKWFAELSG